VKTCGTDSSAVRESISFEQWNSGEVMSITASAGSRGNSDAILPKAVRLLEIH